MNTQTQIQKTLKTQTLKIGALAALLALAPLSAQIDRESDVHTDYQRLRHATLADVQALSAQGYRLSNFEFNQLPPNFNLNGAMIRNTGVYAATWSFYFDKTRAELLQICGLQNARIVDLERYTVDGEERLAALLFENSGQQQKNWHWFSNVPQGSVYSTVSGVGDRIIDIEPYTVDGEQRYHVISIANSGDDQKDWWVYTNTSQTFVRDHMAQHGSRVYDYETESILPYSTCCVLVRDQLRSLTLWGELYHLGWDEDIVNGGRITTIGWDGLSRSITLLDNLDPFTSYGNASVGTMGTTMQSGTGDAFTGTQVVYRAWNFRPWAPTFIAYGFAPQATSLTSLGAPGCWAYLTPLVTELRFANQNGLAYDTLNIPLDPSLAGAELLTQWFGHDPGINALGLQTSKRLTTLVRHW